MYDRYERRSEDTGRYDPETLDPAPAFQRAGVWIAALAIDAAEGCGLRELPRDPYPARRDDGLTPQERAATPAFHWNHWLVERQPTPEGAPPLYVVKLVCSRKHVHAAFAALDADEVRRKCREFEAAALALPRSMAIPVLLDEREDTLPGVETAIFGRAGLFGGRDRRRAVVQRHRLRLVVNPLGGGRAFGMGGAR